MLASDTLVDLYLCQVRVHHFHRISTNLSKSIRGKDLSLFIYSAVGDNLSAHEECHVALTSLRKSMAPGKPESSAVYLIDP